MNILLNSSILTVTILEVAVDWHDLVIAWHIFRPYIAYNPNSEHWTHGSA